MPVITILGASSSLEGSYEYDTALYLGKMLASAGIDIATGGYMGIMEAALKGASSTNVRRIGVTTQFYSTKVKNDYVSEEISTKTYWDRFNKLVEIGDAYIMLPGGTGTLAELANIWLLKSRSLIPDKPFVCIGEQWNEVIQTVVFYSESALEHMKYLKILESAEDAVEYLLSEFKSRNLI